MPIVRPSTCRIRSVAAAVALLGRAAGAAGAQSTAAAAEPRGAAVYTIDPNHSELQFRIRHLVSRVTGGFREWTGTVTVADPARWEEAVVDVAIRTASIDTRQERRDADLRSDSFFDAAKYPVITFRSTRIERRGDSARIHGDLTIKGVTKPVVLEGAFLGSTKDAQGRQRVGFEASTTINRLDYGITWNRAAEGGGLTLADEVEIEIAIAAVQQ